MVNIAMLNSVSRRRRLALVAAGCALAAACSGEPGADRGTALADASGAPRAAAPDASAAPDAAAGPNLERGELLTLACQACHTLGPGESHDLGPNLHGIFGRRAGEQPGFDYSESLRRSDIVWTPAELDRWLAAPDEYIAGTTMAFAGYRSAKDRRDLLAYLERATAPQAHESSEKSE